MNLVNVRASSLAELFDCPARWEAKHLLGMRNPSSGAAQLGTAIHASTALFDQARLDGQPISAYDAAGALVDELYNPDQDVDWEDSSPKQVEAIGLNLHARYCADIAPLQDYVGVEIQCERLEISDLGLALTGTTDRIRRVDGQLGIADLKSGARAVGSDGRAVTNGHAPQLGAYELLAEFKIGQPLTAPAQIVGLQTGKTANSQRIGTGTVGGARALLVGSEEAPGLLRHASQLIHSGAFYGNPKSMLCSARYCPRYASCRFRG
jgi:hypothetical protein